MRRMLKLGCGVVLGIGLIWGGITVVSLDRQVEQRFQGRLFSVPSDVYSVPLLLYPGLDLERAALRDRLRRLHYYPTTGGEISTGEFIWDEREIRIALRGFQQPSGKVLPRRVSIELDEGGRVVALRGAAGRELDTVEIEPERIAAFRGRSRQDRRLIPLSEMPELLVSTVLAVEDRRFYEHLGIDPRRIAGALVANLRAGRVVQGGSTLTQQLVKNFYLSAERTLDRKLREAVMALLLERRHRKEEILAAYLNEVYMGQRGSVGIHGMGEAASHYFAKEVVDLSLAQSALLVGLIKGPNLYSPYGHPERALERRNLVLEVMRQEGWIAEETYLEAFTSDLGVREFASEAGLAPYFVEFLRKDLVAVYGEEILASEGLAIFTTLDPHLQRAANLAVRRGLKRLEADFPALAREESPLQAALVAMSPATGEILAMVGGREFGSSQFNRATQARRQPGSVFKPIVALAALARWDGRQSGFTLASTLQDEPLVVPGPTGEWVPTNYDEEFRGEVTLREAVEFSLNVPVTRLGLAVGPERIIQTARRMGVESPLEPVPSLALGSFELSLLEVARAYAVIASGGVVPVVRGYAEVIDEKGNVLEHKPLDFVRAFDPAETYLVTSLLQGVVDRGTGQPIRQLGLEGPLAGKTGTTNDFRDAWFVGFTTDLLVAVWVGFDDEATLGIPGAVAALPIFADFLQTSAAGPLRPFPQPAGVEWIEIDPRTGLRAVLSCPGERELFLVGTAPKESCSGRPVGPLDRFIDWLRGSS